jgi:hypothetical protein
MLLIQDAPEQLSARQRRLLRLHQWQRRSQWLLVGLIALLCIPPSLWSLRYELALLSEYFTWTGLRYGLAYHPWASLGLLVPLGLILGLLIRQVRDRLWGVPCRELRRLERLMAKIQAQGTRHPLWQQLQD